MAAKKERLQRHQILLNRGDYQAITEVHGPNNAASVIRALVRRYVRDKIEHGAKLDLTIEEAGEA